jgi:serine/threonine protein kinase/tetratricopeptide (TPR) repeat protein
MDGGRLAHYRIISRLGAGGMGEVYRARDEQLDRDVAVKVLPASSFDDPTARARLVREARAAAALNHPNICTVHEVGEADGQAYIAMELVEGRTLSAMLHAGPLPAEHVVHYGRQLADALTHAHERGVIHRDLKSNNVIITPDRRVKVLDFGLAKRAVDSDMTAAVTELHASLTQAGTAIGTPPYMSPEQLRGEPVRVSSDIWALGVVLHEMATGSRPFTGNTPFELSAAILSDDPVSVPSDLRPELRTAIAGCLVKDRKRRYATAGDVRAALDGVQTAVTALPPLSDTERPAAKDSSSVMTLTINRRRALWVGAGTLVVAGSGAAWWTLLIGGPATRSLAVLPLVNTADDEDLEYLCDGIAESLIQQVSKLRSIRVRPLSTVLDFKGPSADPLAAGRRLGVDAVLTGSLERQGTRLRIAARLVDVAAGRPLWTNTYDREEADLLEVQDEIATAIMDSGLRVRLTSTEREQLVRHPTTDGDAYDLFLQSRFHQRFATEEDYLYSRELLKSALVRDPKFALAYLALAGNHGMMATDGLERPSDAWAQVNRYLRQAKALDPDLPEVMIIEHGIAFLFDWDWAGAERARERYLSAMAGDLDPQFLRPLAIEHWALGRPQEALRIARRTRELDPRSANLAILEADYLLRADQFDAAIALYEYAISVEPQNLNPYFGLAEAKSRQGRFDEAIEARRKAHEVAGDDRLGSAFAGAKGEAGYRRIDEAWIRLQLETLKERERTKYVSPLDFARAYAQLGEKELAFKYMDAAFRERSPGLVFLRVDRAWDAVRSDPRFAAAIRLVGLPGEGPR